MSTFTDTIPSHATKEQKRLIHSILDQLSKHYTMEFSNSNHGKGIFFSLRSDRWFDSMVCGTIGPRGALNITLHPITGKRTRHKGRSAWSWIDISCFDIASRWRS